MTSLASHFLWVTLLHRHTHRGTHACTYAHWSFYPAKCKYRIMAFIQALKRQRYISRTAKILHWKWYISKPVIILLRNFFPEKWRSMFKQKYVHKCYRSYIWNSKKLEVSLILFFSILSETMSAMLLASSICDYSFFPVSYISTFIKLLFNILFCTAV